MIKKADYAASAWTAHFQNELEHQKRLNLTRRMVRSSRINGPEAEIDGGKMLLFSTNDYLGYSQRPELRRAARRAVEEWGTGAGASRLVSGNLGIYKELEDRVAVFKHTEDALVFPTGFMANLGVVATLAGPGDVIVSDALNHASLVDACRLSKAQIKIAAHSDVESYRSHLEDSRGRKVLIVTDGVFSMHGDVAPLPELAELAQAYGALLVVDDAHGTGVLGETGRGSLEYFNMPSGGVIQIGTFSKALGSLGGFVAGPALIIEFLKNRARTLFYTTGLPPATLAVNLESLNLIDRDSETRARLHRNIKKLRDGLKDVGLTLDEGPSAIVPVQIGEAGDALRMAESLKERGVFCPAMRPPTVPKGESRLRLTLMAVHTGEQIDVLISHIGDVSKELGLV